MITLIAIIYQKADCIQIDIDPAKISKRFPATVGLVGDAAEIIGNLTAKTAPVEERNSFKHAKKTCKNGGNG